MTKSNRERVKILLEEALAHPEAERSAFLERATNGDQDLCAEVQELLASFQEDDGFLAAPTRQRLEVPSADTSPPETAGMTIGRYKLLQEIGQGGFGLVWMAEQLEPVRRKVALKVIKLGMDTKQVIARFEAERQALALMDHPNIAKIFDGGATSSGRPYFVMELVNGIPITKYCDKVKLDTGMRLKLFIRVCKAVQHAHQKGIIHRDIKPGNVLVTLHDSKPVPKVIDFGIAKAIARPLTNKTLFTEFQQVIGTPEYMSPEQAEMSGLDIDTRADIYSLGVVLYELLTGTLPFEPRIMRDRGYLEMLRLIREEEPPTPSTRVSSMVDQLESVAEQRSTTTRALCSFVRGDLDWIVMKALAKDRSRRYGSPEALADDIERFLTNEPVLASPLSLGYRAHKFVRRHGKQVTAALAILVALIVGLSVSLYFWSSASVLAKQKSELANRKFKLAGTERLAKKKATRMAKAERAAKNKSTLLAVSEREAKVAVLSNLNRFNELQHVIRLRTARAEEKKLYPAWPGMIEAMDKWLVKHGNPMVAAIPRLETTIREVEARAFLRPDSKQSKNLSFPSDADTFLHETLSKLVDELRIFAKVRLAEVESRKVWAEKLVSRCHDRYADLWKEARDAILSADGITASELYGLSPLVLVPQAGLVPIGMNRVTKLWEFYHLASAEDPDVAPPPLDPATGHIDIREDSGIVFVLIPGGRSWLGAQAADVNAHNYDPYAQSFETVLEVNLAPYFIARHEMTQGQWLRLSNGEAPSHYGNGYRVSGTDQAVDLTHPVEQVSWTMSRYLLDLHGLILPTEAQWEYAARAGTKSPWWTGQAPESLIRNELAANLLDRSGKRADLRWVSQPDWPDFDDGYAIHAPVDVLRPNPWGLYHVHGNVSELCREWFTITGIYRDGDGYRADLAESRTLSRVMRGGSYGHAASWARSAWRSNIPEELKSIDVGLRVARSVCETPFFAPEISR